MNSEWWPLLQNTDSSERDTASTNWQLQTPNQFRILRATSMISALYLNQDKTPASLTPIGQRTAQHSAEQYSILKTVIAEIKRHAARINLSLSCTHGQPQSWLYNYHTTLPYHPTTPPYRTTLLHHPTAPPQCTTPVHHPGAPTYRTNPPHQPTSSPTVPPYCTTLSYRPFISLPLESITYINTPYSIMFKVCVCRCDIVHCCIYYYDVCVCVQIYIYIVCVCAGVAGVCVCVCMCEW